MPACNQTKSGVVYVCAACGFEIEVLKSCAESEQGACSCSESLSCCGGPLTLKQ
jgi:DNA-directed RNA polymerase subunit RPC12/RpoP